MIAMNIGGTVNIGSGVSVTMVHAVLLLSFFKIQLHTTGISTSSGKTIYGGEATGFVIHTPDSYNA